jgi:tetratricopeptide (TPR) repeat protein
MNSYRTAIQLLIGQMAEATIKPQQAISQTADYIQTMQSLAEKTSNGPSLLAGIFVSLARDLKDQLEQASDPEKRRRLSEAMLVLGREAAKSDSFSTQYWAAETLISIAEELVATPASQRTAVQAFGSASDILKQIIASEKQNPGFVQPDGFLVKIRLMLAKASRGLGDFKAAMNELAAILQENNALLDVQTEAARTYQAWGDAVNPGFHKGAYLGGRPDPKTRNNLIWGWGKIARVVEGKQDYQEQFYMARYELARSRYKSAAAAKNPQAQQEIFARAAKDITSTATLYPDLGGAAMKKKYDALLKQIQKSLGQDPTGLAGLQKPNN